MNDRRGLLGGLAGMVSLVFLPRAARAQEVKYVYDVHGRLVGVNRTGDLRRYSYDAADNRTERAPGAGPSPAGPLTLSAALSATTWVGAPWTGTPSPDDDPPVSVVVTGGVGPFTYSWRRISGSSRVSAMTGAASRTRFNANLTPPESVNATFVCRVTDALGAFIDSNTVVATVTSI